MAGVAGLWVRAERGDSILSEQKRGGSNCVLRVLVGSAELWETSVRQKAFDPVWEEEAEVTPPLPIPLDPPPLLRFLVVHRSAYIEGPDGEDALGCHDVPLTPENLESGTCTLKLGPRPENRAKDERLDRRGAGFGTITVAWRVRAAEPAAAVEEEPAAEQADAGGGAEGPSADGGGAEGPEADGADGAAEGAEPAAAVEQELRVDPDDGNAYTLAEFQEYYGDAWQEHWEAAAPFDGAVAAEQVEVVAESPPPPGQPQPPPGQPSPPAADDAVPPAEDEPEPEWFKPDRMAPISAAVDWAAPDGSYVRATASWEGLFVLTGRRLDDGGGRERWSWRRRAASALLVAAGDDGTCDIRDGVGWLARLPQRGHHSLPTLLASLSAAAAVPGIGTNIPPQHRLPDEIMVCVAPHPHQPLARHGHSPHVIAECSPLAPDQKPYERTARGEDEWSGCPLTFRVAVNNREHACDRNVRLVLKVFDRGGGGAEGSGDPDGCLGQATVVLSPRALGRLEGDGRVDAEAVLMPRPDKRADHELLASKGSLGALVVSVTRPPPDPPVDDVPAVTQLATRPTPPAHPPAVDSSTLFRSVPADVVDELLGRKAAVASRRYVVPPRRAAATQVDFREPAAVPAEQVSNELSVAPPVVEAGVPPPEGLEWAPYALRPFSRADYASPLWSNILPRNRPVAEKRPADSQVPSAQEAVEAIKAAMAETAEQMCQTELSIDDIWALEDQVRMLTGREPSVDSYSVREGSVPGDPKEPKDRRVIFSVEETSRRASDSGSAHGSDRSRSAVSAASHGTLASRMSMRERGSISGPPRQVIQCPSAQCQAVNVAPPAARGSRAARDLNYCIECGCYLRGLKADGVHEELDRLRSKIEAQELELARMEEFIRDHPPASNDQKIVVGSAQEWRQEADDQLARVRKQLQAKLQHVPTSPLRQFGAGPIFGEIGLDMSPRARRRREFSAKKAGRKLRKAADKVRAVRDAQHVRFQTWLLQENQDRLFEAAATGDAAIFARLARTDPGMVSLRQCCDAAGRNALHVAAAAGQVGVLRACLEMPPTLLVRDALAAARNAHTTVTKEVQQWRVMDVDAEHLFLAGTGKGYTLLHCSVLSGKLYAVEWLVDRIKRTACAGLLRKCVSAKSKQGLTAAALARLHGFSHISHYLCVANERLADERTAARATVPHAVPSAAVPAVSVSGVGD